MPWWGYRRIRPGPSFRVAQALQSFGYRIFPVRPLVTDVLGEQAYPDLESLPELPDIVEVFRAPEHVPAIVDSCIRLGIKHLWLQDGVVHEEAALRAQQAGITVVMDRCMLPRLFPAMRSKPLNKAALRMVRRRSVILHLSRHRMGRAAA